MLSVTEFTQHDFLIMLTADGLIKKTPLSSFQKINQPGLRAMKLKVLLKAGRRSSAQLQMLAGCSAANGSLFFHRTATSCDGWTCVPRRAAS